MADVDDLVAWLRLNANTRIFDQTRILEAASTIESLRRERDMLLENGADKIASALTSLGDGDLFEVEEAMNEGFRQGLEAAAKCVFESQFEAERQDIHDMRHNIADAIRDLPIPGEQKETPGTGERRGLES